MKLTENELKAHVVNPTDEFMTELMGIHHSTWNPNNRKL